MVVTCKFAGIGKRGVVFVWLAVEGAKKAGSQFVFCNYGCVCVCALYSNAIENRTLKNFRVLSEWSCFLNVQTALCSPNEGYVL